MRCPGNRPTWSAHTDPVVPPATADEGASGLRKRRAIAVDGTTLRDSRTAQTPRRAPARRSLHTTRTVIAQRQVATKSNEITAFRSLLAPLDLTDTVVTFDALLTQHDHARFLVQDKNAHSRHGQPAQHRPRPR